MRCQDTGLSRPEPQRSVDEFGFDADLTEHVLLPLLRPMHRRYWRLTQMEHVYLLWGLGGGKPILVDGDDDYAGGFVDTVDGDRERYFAG